MPTYPARIHAILAREAPVGIIIRRGPAKSVCTIGWNRSNDTFQLGQWLRGRIYERRCDLSPDGTHFLYFAMNGRWESETRGTYTAISRAPYLKATTLFPKGDAWQGGGLFTSNAKYWLNGCHEAPTQIDGQFAADEKFRPESGFGAECLSVYYPRLLRDGWRLVERVSAGSLDRMDIFEKPVAALWMLRKFAYAGINNGPGKGSYYDEHELVFNGGERSLPFPKWEWADVDRDRLVWSSEGKLFVGQLAPEGLIAAEVADFNDDQFEPKQAPY